MNRWSGSRLARYSQCLGAAVIPAIEQVRELDAAIAKRGTVLHAFLHAVSAQGYEAALAAVPEEWREDAAVIDVEEMPASLPGSFSPEVRLAWNWRTDTARLVTDDTPVDDATEIGGQLDSLGLTEDAVVVYDYKTGRKFLGRPTDAMQLKSYALFAARYFGKERAHIGFIRITPEGEAKFSRGTLEPWDLDVVALEISELREEAEAVERDSTTPQLREGPECGWCPSFRNCSAKTSLLGALAKGAAFEAGLDTLTPESAAAAYKRIAIIREACELAEIRVREYVYTHGPVPTGGGKELARCEVPKSTLDPEKAGLLLLERYDDTVVRETVKTKVTAALGDLDDAVGSWFRRQNGGKAKGIGKAQEEARKYLAEKGALTVTTTYQYKERKVSLPEASTTQQEGPNHGEG